jgi:hypothetical protein
VKSYVDPEIITFHWCWNQRFINLSHFRDWRRSWWNTVSVRWRHFQGKQFITSQGQVGDIRCFFSSGTIWNINSMSWCRSCYFKYWCPTTVQYIKCTTYTTEYVMGFTHISSNMFGSCWTDIWGGGTEYVLLPCVIMCVPHNVPGGVCSTFDVLYCCWAPVFEVTWSTPGHTVGDIRLQQGTYVVSSAPVQSGISTVCPGVDHVTSNTGAQQLDGRLMVVATTISIWRVWWLRLIITPWCRNHRSPWSNWWSIRTMVL